MNPGDRPKRIKAFHRAAKRGEQWAIRLLKLRETNPMVFLLERYFSPSDFKDLVYNENPFLKMIEKSDSFSGSIVPFPVSLKDK